MMKLFTWDKHYVTLSKAKFTAFFSSYFQEAYSDEHDEERKFCFFLDKGPVAETIERDWTDPKVFLCNDYSKQ